MIAWYEYLASQTVKTASWSYKYSSLFSIFADRKQTEDIQEKLTVNSVLLEQVSDLKEQNNDLRKLLDKKSNSYGAL